MTANWKKMRLRKLSRKDGTNDLPPSSHTNLK